MLQVWKKRLTDGWWSPRWRTGLEGGAPRGAHGTLNSRTGLAPGCSPTSVMARMRPACELYEGISLCLLLNLLLELMCAELWRGRAPRHWDVPGSRGFPVVIRSLGRSFLHVVKTQAQASSGMSWCSGGLVRWEGATRLSVWGALSPRLLSQVTHLRRSPPDGPPRAQPRMLFSKRTEATHPPPGGGLERPQRCRGLAVSPPEPLHASPLSSFQE